MEGREPPLLSPLLRKSDPGVEVDDFSVPFVHDRVGLGPEVRIPEALEFVHGTTLLLDPPEVFEVVNSLPVVVAELSHVVGADASQVARKVRGGVRLCVRAVTRSLLLDP